MRKLLFTAILSAGIIEAGTGNDSLVNIYSVITSQTGLPETSGGNNSLVKIYSVTTSENDLQKLYQNDNIKKITDPEDDFDIIHHSGNPIKGMKVLAQKNFDKKIVFENPILEGRLLTFKKNRLDAIERESTRLTLKKNSVTALITCTENGSGPYGIDAKALAYVLRDLNPHVTFDFQDYKNFIDDEIIYSASLNYLPEYQQACAEWFSSSTKEFATNLASAAAIATLTAWWIHKKLLRYDSIKRYPFQRL